MKDIPIYSTENGVASLALREIPYRFEAYIHLLNTNAPETFLQECISFCEGLGAKRIYATGHEFLEKYPSSAIIKMQRDVNTIPQTNAALFPVQQDTLEKWRSIYNERMRNVPNASYMTFLDAKQMLGKKKAYFVHREGTLLGIGSVTDDTIESVASVAPGAGRDVLLALCSAIYADSVSLQVSNLNEKAIRLYESVGFIAVAEIKRWYSIK